jgi:hypothetical protein
MMVDERQHTLDLFSRKSRTFGPAYDPALDHPRIARQHEVIRDYMLAIGWAKLSSIADALGYPEASISAQLRHLRKPRFGGFQVDKRRDGNAWEYRVRRAKGE